MYLEFARNYATLGKTDLQLARAEAAHELIQGLANEQSINPQTQQALWRSYTALGDVLVSQGHLEAALGQHLAALGIERRFMVGNPVTSGAWQSLSMSYERIGDILKMQGRLTEAINYYRSQLEVAKWLNNADDGSLAALSVAHERIGNVLVALGKKVDALDEYRHMHAINQRLVARNFNNTEWHRNLSVSYSKIGTMLLAEGKLDEALEEYRADLAIMNRLTSGDPSHVGWQRDVAAAHGLIGDVLIAQGDNQGAMRNFESKLSIYERLVTSDPRNAGWQFGLARAHAQIADVYIAKGEFENALASYRNSHIIWERVAGNDPSDVASQIELLWSHSQLALFLDDAAKRIELILSTLRKLKENKKLDAEQERWIPFVEEAHGALKLGDREFQAVMLSIFWHTAFYTQNPIRQVALVVAMSRKLKQENKLTAEQVQWLPEAEALLVRLPQR